MFVKSDFKIVPGRVTMSWCGGGDKVVEMQEQGARTATRLQEVRLTRSFGGSNLFARLRR